MTETSKRPRDFLGLATGGVVGGFPCGSAGKESACNAGDLGLIPGLGRSPGGGHGNPLQYACLENPHGQRRLAGYNPWGHTESNATKHAHPPRLMIQLEHESGKRAVSVRVLCVKHRNKLWLT